MTRIARAIFAAGTVLGLASTALLTLPENAVACRNLRQSALVSWTPLMFTPLPCPEDITSSRSHGYRPPTSTAEQLNQFLDASFDNVTADLVRGSGEYLSSFVSLLDVPATQQAEFTVQLRAATSAHPDALLSPERLLQVAGEQRTRHRAQE